MSEENAATQALQPITDFRLIARNPQELEQSRLKLIDFFGAKAKESLEEIDALEQNLAVAARFPINPKPIRAALNKANKRFMFYEKAKAAVEAGYHIIPNFRADVFAVRTNKPFPNSKQVEDSAGYRGPTLPAIIMPPAPIGDGVYVNPMALYGESRDVNAKGENRITRWNSEFDKEIDFPFSLARVEILQATKAAMVERIFDDLGALPQSRRTADPMVVGIIRDGSGWWQSYRSLTFLVAWFLDTKTLS